MQQTMLHLCKTNVKQHVELVVVKIPTHGVQNGEAMDIVLHLSICRTCTANAA